MFSLYPCRKYDFIAILAYFVYNAFYDAHLTAFSETALDNSPLANPDNNSGIIGV
jgi:hypothetical protein